MQNMSDDPRQILKAAGVEVPEVEAWERLANTSWQAKFFRTNAEVMAAVDDPYVISRIYDIPEEDIAAQRIVQKIAKTKDADEVERLLRQLEERAYEIDGELMTKRKMASVPATGDAAILALARLVAVKHKAALELAERATGTKWADYHDLGIGEDPEGIVAYLTEKHSGEWKLYYDWDADHA